MTEPALDALTAALSDPTPEVMDALRSRLSGDVEVFAPFGVGTGVEAVEALVNHPTVKRVGKSVTWSAPSTTDDGLITTTGSSPPKAAVGGFQIGVRVDDEGRITRIEQDLLPAAPQDPAALALTEEHR